MPTEYRYLVEDIMSGIIVADDLPLNDVRYDDALNRPDVVTGWLPKSSPLATPDILREGRVAVYVEENGRIVAGGPAWTIVPSSGSERITVAAQGWPGYWDRRTIRTDRQFSQVDQFEIVETLIADAQDEVVFGSGYDLGITVTWDALSGVLRDRLDDYRPWKAKNLGAALRELAAVEDGFDMSMRYTFANDRIGKELRLHYPRRGRDTLFVLEFDGDPDAPATNIVNYDDPRDASQMAWVGDGWGDGTDEARLSSSYVDETKRGVYPPLDAAPQFSGVSLQSTLDENTAGAFARSNHPQRLPVLTVDADAWPKWGTYELGDTLRVLIRDGFVQVDGRYRMVAYRMEPVTRRPQLVLEEAP